MSNTTIYSEHDAMVAAASNPKLFRNEFTHAARMDQVFSDGIRREIEVWRSVDGLTVLGMVTHWEGFDPGVFEVTLCEASVRGVIDALSFALDGLEEFPLTEGGA